MRARAEVGAGLWVMAVWGSVHAGARTAVAAVPPHGECRPRPFLARHAFYDIPRKADDAVDLQRARGDGASCAASVLCVCWGVLGVLGRAGACWGLFGGRRWGGLGGCRAGG